MNANFKIMFTGQQTCLNQGHVRHFEISRECYWFPVLKVRFFAMNRNSDGRSVYMFGCPS